MQIAVREVDPHVGRPILSAPTLACHGSTIDISRRRCVPGCRILGRRSPDFGLPCGNPATFLVDPRRSRRLSICEQDRETAASTTSREK
jgi:hypothetical protein